MGVLSIVCWDSVSVFDKSIDQLQQNHRLRMESSISYRERGGLDAFYWRPIFAQDFVVDFNTHKIV